MLVDHLGPSASDKLDSKVVKRSHLTLKSDAVCQKDCDFKPVIPKVRQEEVLEALCGWCSQGPVPDGRQLHQSRPSLSKELSHDTRNGSSRGHSGFLLNDRLPFKILLDDAAILLPGGDIE